MDWQSENKTVSLVVHKEDVSLTSEDIIVKLKKIPVQYIAMPSTATEADIDIVRHAGFQIFWISEPGDGVLKGDAVWLEGDTVWGYPNRINEVSEWVKNKKLVIPFMEFSPQLGWAELAAEIPEYVLKGHQIKARETTVPKLKLWKARLVRAVRERSVQLVYVRFAPDLTVLENLQFLEEVVHEIKSNNMKISFPAPPIKDQFFDHPLPSAHVVLLLVLLITIVTPLVAVILIQSMKGAPWGAVFICICFISVLAGVTLSALLSRYEFFIKIYQVQGIKLQLIAPLILGFLFFLKKEDLQNFGPSQYGGWSLMGIIILGFLFGWIYLMRSGNFPLIPVLDAERYLRDAIEYHLGARPRFKEFLIGHPLLIFGLIQYSRYRGSPHFLKDGRLLMSLGMVGQISIINTFLHVYTPLHFGFLRTFHGIWIALVLVGAVGFTLRRARR